MFNEKVKIDFKLLVKKGHNKSYIMKHLKISQRTYYNWLEGNSIKVAKSPKGLFSLSDLEDLRDKVYLSKKAKEDFRSGVAVDFKNNLPIAIMNFGDMHLDSDGVDLALVYKHLQLLRETEGAYGGNLGDVTNNWVGFLGRLHGEQHTTIEEAIKLAEKVIGGCSWLYTIVGNHDKWNSGEYLIKNIVNTGVVGDDIRLELKFPNKSVTTLHARHHFKGSSMYNTAQGSVKEALLGARDDIVIHGHIHSLGMSIVPQPELLKLSHCISVGSYKKIDNFKTLMGFRETNLSPCVVTVIDPRLPQNHVDRIKVFFDPEIGINYLKFLRGE